MSSTNHGHIRYVPFSLYICFPKIYHSGEEDALIPFVYIQIRYPSHSSPYSLFPTLLKARVIVVGGEQNRPVPKDDPCSIFFLGVDLRGAGLVSSVFLRDERFCF